MQKAVLVEEDMQSTAQGTDGVSNVNLYFMYISDSSTVYLIMKVYTN